MNFVEAVEKFMVACDQTVSFNNKEQSDLYFNLIKEEMNELSQPESDENELKELCDLIWVAVGYGLSKGWNVSDAFGEVARSNMSKVSEDGKVIKNSAGKVIKPPYYSPANVSRYISK